MSAGTLGPSNSNESNPLTLSVFKLRRGSGTHVGSDAPTKKPRLEHMPGLFFGRRGGRGRGMLKGEILVGS